MQISISNAIESLSRGGGRIIQFGLQLWLDFIKSEVIGSELVVNGDFSSDIDWSFSNPGGSNGWIIDAGRAICDSSASTSNRNLSSTLTLVDGKSYRLIIDILQSYRRHSTCCPERVSYISITN